MTMEGNRSRTFARRYGIAFGIILTVIGVIVVAIVLTTTPGRNPSTSPPSPTTVNEPNVTTTDGVVPVKPASAQSIAPTIAPTISAATYIDQLIRSVAIFGGSEFDDATSYQSLALRWLQADAVYSVDGVGAAASSRAVGNSWNSLVRLPNKRLIQRYALVCIYYATNMVSHVYTDLAFGIGRVDPWKNDTHWLSHTVEECEWYGIKCSNSSLTVIQINLNENGLTGSFPREVTLLSHVKRIDLYDNSLWNKGDDGNAWLGEMVSLEYLYYGSTFFDHEGIPSQIARLVNLKEYDCSYTLYRGPLLGTPFLGLDSLEYLSLGGNVYDSSVPSEIASLGNLKRLYLQESSLTGSLDFVANMTSIEEIWLDDNNLVGTIPTTIGNVVNMGSLSVSNNLLHGSIPSEVGILIPLEQLWLYNNTLSGSIPSELQNLDSMKTAYFDGNRLTGVVPQGVCLLAKNRSLEALVTDCVQEIECSCCSECW